MSLSWPRSLFCVCSFAVMSCVLWVIPVPGLAQVGISISVNTAPPMLPVYDQPPIPADGYLWTPGYWAWSDDVQDYYWVPGTWVLAPQPGYLWTPGWWGSNGAVFLWHEGYWGPQVGFYGGVNYGYGYGGRGYEGGYWQGGRLYYNRAVVNVGTTNITNVYNKTVVNNITVNRVSYNGGNGGVQAQATSAEIAAEHAQHLPPTSNQREHVQAARTNPSLRAATNHGAPPIAATARPGAFSGAGVMPAQHNGTMSVMHSGGAPPRPIAPPPPHPAPEMQRETAPPPRPAPPPPHAAPPPPRPSAPPHPERPPEHDHEHG